MPPKKEEESLLTQTPNLRFPETQGGSLGMSSGRIEQTAMNEAMRLGGGKITPESASQVIQTPYGIMSSRGQFSPEAGAQRMTQASFESSSGGIQGFDRPERYTGTVSTGFQRQLSGADDRALAMAQMSERGTAIGQRLGQESTNRYYAFRQDIAERQAREALTPTAFERGRVGRDRTMAGAQALAEAERFKLAQDGRSPMSREPFKAFGMEVYPTGMGRVAPVRGSQDNTNWPSTLVSRATQPSDSQNFSMPSFGNQSLGFGFGQPATSISPVLQATQFGQRLATETNPFQGLITAVGGPQPNRRLFARKNLNRGRTFSTLPFMGA